MTKLLLITILSIFMVSCIKEELQYQPQSTNLHTYFVSTNGGEAKINYKTKNEFLSFTQHDEAWHSTISLNKGDTVYISVYTETGCTLNMYTAYSGHKTYYTENHYLQSYHKVEIAYIIDE